MNVSLWLWVGLWAGGPALVEDFEALPAERQTTGIAGASLRGGGDGTGREGLPLPARHNLTLAQGTICLWVCPLDWRGDDSFYHYFLSLRLGRAGYLVLYKHYSPSTGLMFGWDPDEAPARRFSVTHRIADWAPGQWHHVAATWADHDRVALYVDGRRVASVADVGLPPDERLPERLYVGNGQTGHPGHTAIDALRLYRRALSAAEVLDLYAEHAEPEAVAAAREALPADDPPPTVRIAHAVLDHRLLAAFRADALAEPIATGRLTVVNGAGATVLDESLRPGADGAAEGRCPTEDWPLGRYLATLTLLAADGRELGRRAVPFRIETHETWETAAHLGLEPAVPPPYRPPALEGDVVIAAESRIRLGEHGLPVSVVAAGEELLAAPVTVLVNGVGPGAPSAGAPRLEGGRVIQAAESGQLSVRTVVEYDGLCWFEVTVPPAVAREARSIALEVPLRRDQASWLHAVYTHRAAHERPDGYRVLPRADGELWASPEFTPAVWLGSDRRGLGWFAESDEYWSRAPGPPVTVRGEGERLILACRWQTEPPATDQTRVYRFGLQPTPVRALAPGWRREQWIPSADTTRYLLELARRPEQAEAIVEPPDGRIAYTYGNIRFCNLLPNDPDLMRRQVAQAARFGLFLCPYTDIQCANEAAGEAWLHGDELAARPGARFATAGGSGLQTLAGGRAADYYVWFAHHLATEYGLNGLYIDEAWAPACAGPEPAGYDEGDTRRPTFELLARRETLRRVRNVYAATGRPFRILLHLSAARVPPLLSSADQVLLGEEFYTLVTRDPVYAHSLTPERVRAAFLARSIGLPTVLLPQFKASAERMRDPALARGVLAVALPHDLPIWPLFIADAPIRAARRQLAAAGALDPEAEFVGYWESRPPARDAPEGILVSAYLTRPDGRPAALLVVSNLTDEAVEARLAIDAERLGLPAVPDLEPLEGRAAWRDGRMEVSLAAQDYALALWR